MSNYIQESWNSWNTNTTITERMTKLLVHWQKGKTLNTKERNKRTEVSSVYGSKLDFKQANRPEAHGHESIHWKIRVI